MEMLIIIKNSKKDNCIYSFWIVIQQNVVSMLSYELVNIAGNVIINEIIKQTNVFKHILRIPSIRIPFESLLATKHSQNHNINTAILITGLFICQKQSI